MNPDRPAPGRYRHYKGGTYQVVLTARHSETEEWLVVYRSEATGEHWVRPLALWNETVAGAARFAPIEAAHAAAPVPEQQGAAGR